MTRDRARKIAQRQRAAATGDSFTRAGRTPDNPDVATASELPQPVFFDLNAPNPNGHQLPLRMFAASPGGGNMPPSGPEILLTLPSDRHLLIVGQAGSGKTVALRAFADALTLTDNNPVVEIDPIQRVVTMTSNDSVQEYDRYVSSEELEELVRDLRDVNWERAEGGGDPSLVVIIDSAERLLRSRQIFDDLAEIAATPGTRLVLALPDHASTSLPMSDADVLSFGPLDTQTAEELGRLAGRDAYPLLEASRDRPRHSGHVLARGWALPVPATFTPKTTSRRLVGPAQLQKATTDAIGSLLRPDDTRPVIVLGRTGTGKSAGAASIAHALSLNGEDVVELNLVRRRSLRHGRNQASQFVRLDGPDHHAEMLRLLREEAEERGRGRGGMTRLNIVIDPMEELHDPRRDLEVIARLARSTNMRIIASLQEPPATGVFTRSATVLAFGALGPREANAIARMTGRFVGEVESLMEELPRFHGMLFPVDGGEPAGLRFEPAPARFLGFTADN